MLDVAISIFAWMGVVLIQAMVHYKLGGRRRHEKEMEEVDADDCDFPPPSLEDVPVGEPLDGDEPQVFFQLLSQSGSEMVTVRWMQIMLFLALWLNLLRSSGLVADNDMIASFIFSLS